MVRREALGKGIGALFSEQEEEKAPESEVTTNELEVNSKKLGVITQDKREREKTIPEIKGLKSRRHSPAIKINKTP